MEERKFRLAFKGDITAGAESGDVKNKLCALFKTDISKIEMMFTGNTTIIKKDIPEHEALKLKAAFDKTGAIAIVEPAIDEAPPMVTENKDQQNFTCPKCGAAQEKTTICVSCGVVFAKIRDNVDIQVPAHSQQTLSSPPLTPMSTPPQYERVGGFLLLFCLGLTVFGPLITLVSLATGYNEVSQYFDQFPGLLYITVIDTFLSVGVMTFSVYAGIGLWRIRPGAVQTAKRYLLCFLGYQAIAAILPFMAGLPSAANGAMLAEIGKDTFRGVIYFAIWYSYLNKSQRVQATYAVL